MRNIQKIGATGAFLQATYFLVLVLFVTTILPSQGFSATSDAYHNPAIALPFAAKSPLRALDELRDILWGIGLVVTALALYERWQSDKGFKLHLMVTLAIMSATLLFSSGISGFTSISELAKLYPQNPTDTGSAYLAITLLGGGIRGAAIMLFGGWGFVTSWLALKKNEFSKPLNYVGLGVGLVSMGALIVPLAKYIILIFGWVWLVWLGIALWRTPK
jgi:hypothetical protein